MNVAESTSPHTLIAQQAPWMSDGRKWLFDYCLLPYEAAFESDALDARNLLHAGLAQMGLLPQAQALLARIVAAFGPHRTVWGIALDHKHGTVSLELYFYRRPHSAPDLSIGKVTELLAPTTQLRSTWPQDGKWQMFSVELNAAQLGEGESVIARVYSDVTGLSYAVDGQSLRLENRYDFHCPRRDIDAILEQLRASVHAADNAQNIAARLPPQLLSCYHVCVAQKRAADAVYFSRITTQQLLFFMRQHQWPVTMIDLLADHKPRFDHVRWDVGASYQRDGQQLIWSKTGIYASL